MKLNKLSPNFAVNEIKETVIFYEKHFGFKLIMAVPENKNDISQTLTDNEEYVYAIMQKDNTEIMFQRSDSFKEDIIFAKDLSISATVSFYMQIKGIDELYEKLKNSNIEITDIKTTWYGMKEFYAKDINGYILGFAEEVQQTQE